jgi:hypothetical protein
MHSGHENIAADISFKLGPMAEGGLYKIAHQQSFPIYDNGRQLGSPRDDEASWATI